MNRLVLWIAQGGGIGRVPVAPGTFGSLLGLLWFALLLLPGSLPWFLTLTLAGLAFSVWTTARAEQILHRKDPSSVVIDEVTAIPLCFLAWILVAQFETGSLPSPHYLVSTHGWPIAAGVFLAFRFFDVLKPWPVRQSQSLPGGWGVTIDDALAAVYVNLVVLAVYALKPSLPVFSP